MINPGTIIDQITETAAFLAPSVPKDTKIGIITGSGLDRLADFLEINQSIPYSDIPGFPNYSVAFQASQWINGFYSGSPVVLMNGRFHYYEGHSMQGITLPVRVMQKLGIHTLFITHAAGSIQPQIKPGSIGLITDHINLMGNNPLIGPHFQEKGVRFPDMSDVYTPALQQLVIQMAASLPVELHQTIYGAISGPSLPTGAEIRGFQRLGIDTIGMSVVPEVLTAKQLSMQVLALTAVTDQSLPEQDKPVDRKQVAGNADALVDVLNNIFVKLINHITG